MAHLVRLPEQRHLLGDALLGLRAARSARGAGSSSRRSCTAMRMCASRTVRRVASVGCAVSTSRIDVVVRALVDGLTELLERVLERLARDAAVVRVLTPAAQSVMLLGEVRELEVEAERAQHERLLARAQIRIDARRRCRRAARTARRGGCARRARAATRPPARRARCRGSSRAGGRRGAAARRCRAGRAVVLRP